MYMSSFSEGQPLALADAARGGEERCTFHDPRRCSWSTLAGIALAHVALIAALVLFDVIPIGPAKPEPLAVTMVPLEIAPPPPPSAAPPPPDQKQMVQPTIVAPPPIVQTPAPPTAVAVTAIVSPEPPAPAAVPAAVAAPSPTPGPTAIETLSPLPGNPPLKYPASARRLHQQGIVRLRILIATDGSVTDIAIAQSSGFDSLDKAAIDVVRRWRFRPAKRDGVAVEGIGIFPASFKLA
jgi:periplasmic protein TonB